MENKEIIESLPSGMQEEVDDDDLEDGEIETDEDDDDDEPVITAIIPAGKNHDTTKKTIDSSKNTAEGLAAAATSVAPSSEKKSNKFKRPEVVDDDWAGKIESAIAAALKKDGIEPPISKRITTSNMPADDYKIEIFDEVRKKRKRKNRDDKEKIKQKRSKQHHQQDHGKSPAAAATDDFDDDEMLCVRGGSPPSAGPGGHQHHHHSHRRSPSSPIQSVPSTFYESDYSESSYDSYDSAENRKATYEERRQSRRAKDRRRSKFTDGGGGGGGGANQTGRGSNQAGTGGGSGVSKRRNRHDSDGGDDCPRSHDARAQRKLELCKFYLMDCCAKKDKCSYMHGDFPCKYYYLGMECVYKAACKFSHGKPLTEQLRNILLKHIETAPKEILGNFRRISRENATGLLLTTHAKLCAEYNVENTMEMPAQLSSSSISSYVDNRQSLSPSEHRAGNPFGTPSHNNNNSAASLLAQQQTEQVSPRKDDKDKSNSKNDKPRKSRWCDFSTSAPPSSQGTQQPTSISPSSSSCLLLNSAAPVVAATGTLNSSEILSLRNLKGVITPEQIEKLSLVGIENLEQISQLTVAQLNNVGLTIGQINEIQLNALNIQKLGLISNNSSAGQQQNAATTSSSSAAATFNDDNQSINSSGSQDVDMRFLVGAVQASSTASTSLPPKLSTTKSAAAGSLQDVGIASPEPTPNSGKSLFSNLIEQNAGGVASTSPPPPPTNTTNLLTSANTTMDYTQYLKDSNLVDPDKIDFNDLLSDDKDDDDALNEDEPELLIDESRCPSDDEADLPNQSLTTEKDLKPMPAIYDPKLLLPLTTKFNVLNSTPTPAATTTTTDDELWNNAQGNSDGESKNGSRSNYDEKLYRSSDDTKRRDSSDEYRSGGGLGEASRYSYYENTAASSSSTNSGRNDYYGSAGNRNDFYGSRDSDYSRYGAVGSTTATATNFYGDERKDSAPKSDRYRDPRFGYFNSSQSTASTNLSAAGSKTPVDNYDGDWDTDEDESEQQRQPEQNKDNDEDDQYGASSSTHDAIIPPIIVQPSPPPKYNRTSIYDGVPRSTSDTTADDDDSQDGGGSYTTVSSSDRDMRLSILDTSDIDLRLPFKPVMTNYTPATEIDGSITSHPPIVYKVYEIHIPKPDYSEIRRCVTVTEKTLDPRLRRIFCLKENDNSGYDSDLLRSPPPQPPLQSTSILLAATKSSSDPQMPIGGPRIDPRRRKDSQIGGPASLMSPTSLSSGGGGATASIGQNVDIRLLLQKSHWYKNLNSKFKIMVNQQLALVSTELKKFHQDPSPDKLFDMKFLATNQYLQQVLTNLGIFIDGNGQILQLDAESEIGGGVNDGGGPMMMVGGAGMMMAAAAGGMMMDAPPMGMSGMDFMRPPQPGMAINSRFMGGMMGSGAFGPRFGDIRPGLLGVAPGINPYNSFDPSTGNEQFGGFNNSNNDDYGGGGGDQQGGGYGNNSGNSNNPFDQGNSGGKFYGRHDDGGRQSGNRGNRNFRQGGGGGGGNSRNNSNDRWGGGNSGGQGGGSQGRSGGMGRNNRNYEGRGRDRDGSGGRRDKQK